MSNNIISIYRTINDSLYSKLQISMLGTYFYYTEGDEEMPIVLEDQEDSYSFYMGKSSSLWDPNTNNLIVERAFTVKNPNVLFGNHGVTTDEGKLGIGVHIYSRSSNFQTTIPLPETITKDSKSITIQFRHIFKKSEIKGEVVFNFFVYIKNKIKNVPMFANIPGIRLGKLNAFSIIVDGDGSTFPIVQVAKGGEPLWNIVANWTDVSSDTFNIDNVRIEINSKHHMYDYIYKPTKPSQYLLAEILSNAVSQIIFKVVNDNDFETDGEFMPDSIASVVSYWLQTFEVEIASLETINYSVRKKIESIL